MSGVNKKNHDIGQQFALRFRLLMSYHDLTLKDVADSTNSAVSTVGTWKNGRIPSNMETLRKLAELFHVSVEFLLDGKARTPDPSMSTAVRILQDIDDLLRELGDGDVIREPQPPEFDSAPTSGEPTPVDDTTALRHKIVRHFASYLAAAQQHPQGLPHTWVRLSKEFPLDYFKGLE